MMRIRKAAALAGCALIALSAVQPAFAAPRLGRGGGFSVSGKDGPFLKQIEGRSFQGGGAGALGLASDAINQGQYQAARLPMPQTEAKIKALLDRIEANWPYAKDTPVKVHVLGVDNYQAYALPDGSIIIGFGLLDMAKSDDEIAFVLAHELGHIRLGHFDKGTTAEKPGSLSQAAAVLAVGSAVGAAGGFAGMDAGALGAVHRATAANDLLRFMNNTMVSPDHSREYEDESDALGFDLSNLAPYSAETASARVFDTIQADEERRAKLSEQLNEQLKKELTSAVKDGSAASMVMTGMAGGSIRGGLLRGAGRVALGMAASSSEGGAKHRTPEDRKKGIADYSVAAYPEGLPLRDESTAWLDELRGSPEYAGAKATVAAVKEAMIKRAAGDLPGAEAELAKANAGAFARTPLVINTAARIRGDMGDKARSDALFNEAHQSPDQTVDGYVDHVRMLYENGDADKAIEMADAGAARFGDQKPFLALMIGVYKQAGMDTEVQQYLQRCLAAGDPGLKKDCETAAGQTAATADSGGGRMPGLGGLGGLLGR